MTKMVRQMEIDYMQSRAKYTQGTFNRMSAIWQVNTFIIDKKCFPYVCILGEITSYKFWIKSLLNKPFHKTYQSIFFWLFHTFWFVY